jgi:hypothetical protein
VHTASGLGILEASAAIAAINYERWYKATIKSTAKERLERRRGLGVVLCPALLGVGHPLLVAQPPKQSVEIIVEFSGR